jgi:Icc-related predicted phosphoesterase
MKVVCISDTHNKHEQIEIPECDLLLHTGDFSSRGYKHEFQNFVKWLDKQPAKHKVFISGNHDYICQKEREFVAEFVADYDVHYLLDSSVEIEGLKIYGSPWQPWFHNWAFNFNKNDHAQAISTWAKIPDDTDVLLTHGPPYKVLDRVARVMHAGEDPNVGCKFLLGRVMEVKPKLHVFGHIHEAYGQLEHNGTLFINAASCTLQYQPTNLATVTEL